MSNKRTAFITGASTGFGFRIAKTLASDGYTVYASMRDIANRNAGPKRELEAAGIHVVELDVTSDASVDAVAARILGEVSSIDVLVNNAGTAHMDLAETHSADSFARQLATNVVGPHRVNRAFLPAMRKAGSGLIVFISSVVGRFALPFTGIYNASKWAIEGYAETLSYELRPLGIDVAIVEPGAYATNIFNAIVQPDDAARSAEYGETGKMFATLGEAMNSSAGDPQEIADAIAALARADAGTRPLRTVVPAGPVDDINAAVEPLQRAILEAYGMGAMLPKAPVAS